MVIAPYLRYWGKTNRMLDPGSDEYHLLACHNLDEVHAYDPHMSHLLEKLLYLHGLQGGAVILLTATLPYLLRTRLSQVFSQGIGGQPMALGPQASYP